MAIQRSATEEDAAAASCIEEDEERDVLDTAASDDIDLEALMQRYKGSLSASLSEEEIAPEPVQKVESAGSDEDEYAARANNIMQRYKLKYAVSDDSEQTSADSVDGAEEESQVDVDEASDNFGECIEDSAEELINTCHQAPESSEVKIDEEEVVVIAAEVDLLENVEIGEDIVSQTFEKDAIELVSKTVTKEHVEEVKSESFEQNDLEQIESSASEEEDVNEVKSESFDEEEMEEVEIGEEVEEEEEEVVAVASTVTGVEASTSIVDAKVEASASNCDDLEEMVTKLMQENEELKKKKELQKRIYLLAQENEKLKRSSPKRNALADMACKFDDAVTTAVARVSKIMVCAPTDEDIFDSEGAFTTMSQVSGEHQNGVCTVGSESDDVGLFEYDDKVLLLSPVSHMTDENTHFFQSAPSQLNSFQLKMQAYNKKYQLPQESLKSKPTLTVEEALREARIATGVPDTSLDDAMSRVKEAKQFIKNRSVLKAKENF